MKVLTESNIYATDFERATHVEIKKQNYLRNVINYLMS